MICKLSLLIIFLNEPELFCSCFFWGGAVFFLGGVLFFRGVLTNSFKYFDTAIWMHYVDANETAGEEARRQLHKNAASNIEQFLGVTLHKAPTIRPPASHHENYPS